MRIREAAARLGVTERMLRHYERAGLLEAPRAPNGYRRYGEAELRRAARIRDLIATGFSTREVRAMAACLSDENSGPCEAGIPQLTEKLAHIDRLRADLEAKRGAVLSRLASLRAALASRAAAQIPPHDAPDRHSHTVPHGAGGRAPTRHRARV